MRLETPAVAKSSSSRSNSMLQEGKEKGQFVKSHPDCQKHVKYTQCPRTQVSYAPSKILQQVSNVNYNRVP